MYYILLIHL